MYYALIQYLFISFYVLSPVIIDRDLYNPCV